MKTAFVIAGWSTKEEFYKPERPAPTNDHWYPWIQKQLLIRDILAQTPEMPVSYDPDYEKWKWMMDQFEIDKDSVLIGHSCGGGFLVRWLSENKKKVGKIILVAPWLDPEHLIDENFFKFDIDPELASRVESLTIMYSLDDEEDILQSIEMIKKSIPGVRSVEFKDKGHFVLESMHTTEFPELLEVCLEE